LLDRRGMHEAAATAVARLQAGFTSAEVASKLLAHFRRVGIGGVSSDTTRGRSWIANASEYGVGLLLPGERKSMRPLSDRMPDGEYERLQNFITDSPWDWRASQEGVVRVMKEEASGPDGVLVVDDVPLVKQGDKSPGVGRQYCGVTGGVANCQALVDVVYALPPQEGGLNRETIAWGVGMSLYLPRSWTDDPKRCAASGIPAPVEFKQKWRIALDLVDRARNLKVPHRATLADMGYGDLGEFRRELRARHEPYVLAITPTEVRVIPADTRILERGERFPGVREGPRFTKPHLLPDTVTLNAHQIAKEATEASRWRTLTWAQGTKGPLTGRFTRVKVRTTAGFRVPSDEVGWLLIENHSEGIKSWICWGLDDASLLDLAKLAHARWTVERFHEEVKMELGLDHFEGRSWNGLNHHVTIVLMTHSFLTVQQLQAKRSGIDIVLPTLAEARRRAVKALFFALLREFAPHGTLRERELAERVANMWANTG